MVDAGSVPSAYLSIAFLTVVGILMPMTNFIMSWALRPRTDPSRPHITRSYLLEGYERDHSLYPRRLSTFECGSEPIGDAMIQFHFQYYWYAIVFLVFDVAFMFLVLGGMVTAQETSTVDGDIANAEAGLSSPRAFFAIMSLGVWYVFRKRGRIYI
jgi:NADH:ubiquinone oxidoreductase subunit 3 (subunit A)